MSDESLNGFPRSSALVAVAEMGPLAVVVDETGIEVGLLPETEAAAARTEVARRELRGLMKSVRYPDDWFYVERAAVMSFWLIGQLAPDLDAMKIGFPYVLPLLAARTAAAPTAMTSATQAGNAAAESPSASVG